MPTVPIKGKTDFTFQAHFRERQIAELGMVANFVNPVHTTTLAMSARFRGPGHMDLPMAATFRQVATATLPISANFRNPTSIANVRMSARFFAYAGTKDLLSNAIFRLQQQLNMSATFIQHNRRDLVMNSRFVYASTLPMSATVRTKATTNLRMRAFLGSFKTDLGMTATFYGRGYANIPATITIQNYLAPKNIVVPGQADVQMRATFRGPTVVTLRMAAVFGGKTANDFDATIQITNKKVGVGGVPITVIGGVIPITVNTDATGYFHIGNLPPGSYLVTPVSQTIKFSPPSFNITISDANVTLYFHADGSFANSTLTPVPLPLNTSGQCVLIPNNDQPGTFSIDGFVLPGDYSAYTSILVTAVSEDEAAKFRQTFGMNVGEGT